MSHSKADFFPPGDKAEECGLVGLHDVSFEEKKQVQFQKKKNKKTVFLIMFHLGNSWVFQFVHVFAMML